MLTSVILMRALPQLNPISCTYTLCHCSGYQHVDCSMLGTSSLQASIQLQEMNPVICQVQSTPELTEVSCDEVGIQTG